jgi:hypothetical protein
MKVVWLDLNRIANNMKEIRKKRKRKEEKKIKIENGPGNQSGPAGETAHGPPGVKTRIGTPSLSLLPLMVEPTCQTDMPDPTC